MRVLLLLLAAFVAALVLATATPSVTPARTPTATPESTATSAPAATATATAPARATPTPVMPTLQPTPTLVPTATPEPMDAPELRAVWVDAFHDGFKTPQQVDRLLAWARSANLNALFVQVRRRGDAYYLNSFEPRSEDPDLQPGFDALQYLIDRAHQGPQRIQVHAWLATLPIWGRRDTPPLADSHVFNQHGPLVDPADSWLMYRDDGAAWAGSGQDGIYYLDPGNPEAARYTTEVYLNVVRKYDVDGIHLDQVRYYEGGALHWGYNPASVAAFNQRFGRDSDSQPAPDDPDWIAWRRDQVSALVRRIYLETKAIKPRVAVSAAVVTWGKGPRSAEDWERQAPYAAVLQDWRAWLQEGSLDFVVPMNYYRETNVEGDWFDAWTRWQAVNRGRRSVVVGLGAYLNAADGVESQLARARSLGTSGVALYSYAVPTRDLQDAPEDARAAFAAELRSAFFARPAPVPELPTAGGVLVEIPGRADAPVVLQDNLGLQHAWRTDTTGVAGGLDLPAGAYTLRVDAPGVDPTPVHVQVGGDSVTVVRYAPAL